MEIHGHGIISIENMPDELECDPGYIDGDFEVLTAEDGRVWININGTCFLRFKPEQYSGLCEKVPK